MIKFTNNSQDHFEDDDAAFNDVKRGASKGYLVFPDNFTNHMKNRALQKKFADNETLDGSTITVHMDFSGEFGKNF